MEALCCRNSALAEQLGKIEATALHHEPRHSWPSPGLQGRPRKPPPRDWARTREGPRCTGEGTRAHASPQHTEPLGPGSSQLPSSWKGTEEGQMPLGWVLSVATSGDLGTGEQQGATGQQLWKSWLNAHPQMFLLCFLYPFTPNSNEESPSVGWSDSPGWPGIRGMCRRWLLRTPLPAHPGVGRSPTALFPEGMCGDWGVQSYGKGVMGGWAGNQVPRNWLYFLLAKAFLYHTSPPPSVKENLLWSKASYFNN